MVTARERRGAITRLKGSYDKIAKLYARDYGVKVVLGPAGSPAMADLEKRVVYIPIDTELAEGELRRIVDALLDHEVGHIRAETEFGAGERPSDFLKMAVDSGKQGLKSLLNSFEDGRTERDSSRRWPGVEDNLEFKNKYYARIHKEKLGASLDTEDEPPFVEIFMRGLDFRLRFGAIPEWIPTEISDYMHEIDDVFSRADESWSPRQSWELTQETWEHIKDLFSPEEEGGGGSGEDGGGGAAGDGIPTIEEEMWAEASEELEEETADGRTFHLPHPGAKAMDKVITPRVDDKQYKEAYDEARPAISSLVKRLAMWLRAQVPVMRVDQNEGDIDEDALPYVLMNEDRIFEMETPGIRLDTAWVVLVDQSGSMHWSRRYYWARVATICIGEALHRCGIPFEIWGWDTDDKLAMRTPDGVHTRIGSQRHLKYKGFDEPWPRTRRRCGSIHYMKENDDVEAIYHGARRLLTRKEKHKMLVVLTDGYPAHAGLRHERFTEGGWWKRQLKDALALVRKAGITDIGVGIESTHVDEFYKNTLHITDLSLFGPKLVRLVQKAVRGR